MYGAGPSAGGGATLAATGLGAGSAVLTVIGVIFTAWGIWMLVRRHSSHRP